MNFDKYYDTSWYDAIFNKMRSLGLADTGQIIFDVGAGNSVLKERVNKTGAKWVGFDYLPREEYIKPWNVEQETIETEEKPDCILFLEVIEHLFNPGFAIQNIDKVAKKGTYFMITTPNPFWSINRIKYFFQGIFPNFTKEDMDDNHHVFTVWPHVLEKMLVDNGYKIIDSFTLFSRARFPKVSLNPVFIIKILFFFLRKAFEKIDKKTKGMSYGVIAIKE